MSTALAELCTDLGIEIVDIRQSRSRRPGQTCAERTLLKILADEGYAHLRSVLMSIMETENNKLMLVAPVIWAISDVLRGHPTWFGDAWLTALDKIDLAELYGNAKKSREAVSPRHAIATMIIERLRPLFVDQPQARLL
jgi:hypothetical protein